MSVARGVLVLLSGVALCACPGSEPAQTSAAKPPSCPQQYSWRAADPNERPNGVNPNTVLEPYYDRTWHGTLVWRDGATAPVTFSTHTDPSKPVQAYLFCGRVGQFFRELSADVRTDDGLSMSMELVALVRLPSFGSESLERDEPNLGLRSTLLGKHGTALVSRFPAYHDPRYELVLSWRQPDYFVPSGGVLQMHAALDPDAGATDIIQLATLQFDDQDDDAGL